MNPTNVRGSATLQQAAAADSLARPASAMARSHSLTTASHREPHIRRAVVRHTSAQPAEQEETPPPQRSAPDNAERSQVRAARLAVVGVQTMYVEQSRDRAEGVHSDHFRFSRITTGRSRRRTSASPTRAA